LKFAIEEAASAGRVFEMEVAVLMAKWLGMKLPWRHTVSHRISHRDKMVGYGILHKLLIQKGMKW
jgi:hypothetical protein